MPRSYAALCRSAGKPVRERQQHEDKSGEYRDRGENAADHEIGGLLEQSKDQAGDDSPTIVTHPAERYWNEAVERQQRRVGEEGEQQLAASESRKCSDHTRKPKARDAQIA